MPYADSCVSSSVWNRSEPRALSDVIHVTSFKISSSASRNSWVLSSSALTWRIGSSELLSPRRRFWWVESYYPPPINLIGRCSAASFETSDSVGPICISTASRMFAWRIGFGCNQPIYRQQKDWIIWLIQTHKGIDVKTVQVIMCVQNVSQRLTPHLVISYTQLCCRLLSLPPKFAEYDASLCLGILQKILELFGS
jgi:hypothetical protein